MSGPLPAALASLEPYMAHWARATEYERMAARISATPAQIKSFYDAALHVLPDLLTRIDAYPVGAVPDEAKPLLYIALSLAEVAPNVEFYKCSPGVPFAFDETRLRADHGVVPG